MYSYQLCVIQSTPFTAHKTILKTYALILYQDAGHQFILNGERHSLRGTIAFVSGDNLGSQLIGGFKEGAGARLKCRHCMGSAVDIQTKVSYSVAFIIIVIINHWIQGLKDRHHSFQFVDKRTLLRMCAVPRSAAFWGFLNLFIAFIYYNVNFQETYQFFNYVQICLVNERCLQVYQSVGLAIICQLLNNC